MLCGCALKQGVFHRYIQSVIGYLVVPNYSLDIVGGHTFFINYPLNNIAYGINSPYYNHFSKEYGGMIVVHF